MVYIEAILHTKKRCVGDDEVEKKKVVPGLCFGIEINKLVKKDEST